MEEDIKQLEELILDRKSFVIGDKEHDEIYLKDISAIENLIKGYRDGEDILKNTIKENLEFKEYIRELERKLKIKNGDIEWMQNKINKHFIDDVTLQRDYIPKSKMQREMEKLDNMMKETINKKLQKYTPGEIIFLKEFLQELMEDK